MCDGVGVGGGGVMVTILLYKECFGVMTSFVLCVVGVEGGEGSPYCCIGSVWVL